MLRRRPDSPYSKLIACVAMAEYGDWTCLPLELQVAIFAMLTPKVLPVLRISCMRATLTHCGTTFFFNCQEVAAAGMVSHLFHGVATHEALWRLFCLNTFEEAVLESWKGESGGGSPSSRVYSPECC